MTTSAQSHPPLTPAQKELARKMKIAVLLVVPGLAVGIWMMFHNSPYDQCVMNNNISDVATALQVCGDLQGSPGHR